MCSKKKILTIISLSLFAISILSFGTYALYNTSLLTDNNSISTGKVKMSYSESNEITLNNVVPTSDKKGTSSTDYFEFKVNTYIKTNKEMTMNYNIVLEPLDVDSSYTKFNDSDIKVNLTKVDNNTETLVTGPITIYELNQYVLKSQKETFNKDDTEHSTTYRLRAWLDYNFDASKINNKTYSYKFRVNVNNEAAPKLLMNATQFAKANVGTNGLEKITHEIDDTLQVDSKFATEYRYRGGNSVVKNYVTFNNEVWRIIGVIPTEDTDGNVENRIKIMKDEPIGNMKWNGCTTSDYIKCDDTNNINNWTTATLNTYLNNDYYNTLNSNSKSMIGTAKYYLGGYNTSQITTDIMWQYERKKTNGNNCTYDSDNEVQNGTCYFFKTNPIMQNDESKKIAIMYVSDYGYGASKECTYNLEEYDSSESCQEENNWLNKAKFEVLLSPDPYSSYAVSVVSFDRVDFTGSATDALPIFPTMYLSSNVKISSGSGTSSDPYQLSL